MSPNVRDAATVGRLRRFKPYPAYKDSGIEWLGELPTKWKAVRLKRVFRIVNGSTPQTGVLDYWDGDIPWVTPEDLGELSGTTIADTRRHITRLGYESCGTTLAPAGSLVLSTRAPVGHLAIAEVAVCTNQGCRTLVFRTPRTREYFYYQLRAASAELESLAQGSTFKELAADKLAGISLAEPPGDEQRDIAAFLDRETARIDALVAEKRRLIDLLNELRASLITRAVTKGLDPNVLMRDSGVEWLGRIPAHWQVATLGRLATVLNGSTPLRGRAEYWDDGMIPWLTSAQINRGVIDSADELVSEVAVRDCHLPWAEPEGVLIAITGEGQTRGRVALLTIRATISQHLASLKPRDGTLTAPFLRRFLEASYDWLRSESSGAGSTKAALTCEFLKSVPVTLPPPTDQLAIAESVDSRTAEIERLLARVRNAIDRLREYRTALISAAVTGKIDVREEVA